MISSEVQRTLVKSPPELWAELSDPASLARHLGELGEIRITRTEAEKTVEWEAENTTGTVSIQASGWGTRVTLSVTKEIGGAPCDVAGSQPAADDDAAAAAVGLDATVAPSAAVAPHAEVEDVTAVETVAEPGSEALPGPDALATAPTSSELQPDVLPEPAGQESAAAEPELAAAELKPAEHALEPRRGFFARLFGRKRKVEAAEPQPSEEQAPTAATVGAAANTTTVESSDAFAAVREALTPESVVAVDLFAVVPATQALPQDASHKPETKQPAAQPDQLADIAAELRAAEEVAEEEVTAVLAAVLDRLGAAHHRPFSRS